VRQALHNLEEVCLHVEFDICNIMNEPLMLCNLLDYSWYGNVMNEPLTICNCLNYL
jgi:hypothetical protein